MSNQSSLTHPQDDALELGGESADELEISQELLQEWAPAVTPKEARAKAKAKAKEKSKATPEAKKAT